MSYIGDKAFASCGKLTNVVIPNSVMSIGDSAFESCCSITKIETQANNNYKSIEGSLYSQDGKILIKYAIGKSETSFVVPFGVSCIAESAFSNCCNLTHISIPDSVTEIEDNAFSGCKALASIILPDSIVSVGNYAFSDCTQLLSVSFGKNLKKVGVGAFSCCEKLEVITWNATECCYPGFFEHKIYYSNDLDFYDTCPIFNDCKNLKLIHFGYGVKIIPSWVFNDCLSLTEIMLPDSVLSIQDHAFMGCTNLSKVTISCNIHSIGGDAFEDCDSLSFTISNNAKYLCDNNGDCIVLFDSINKDIKSCIISDNTRVIHYEAFAYCQNLYCINIPASVVSIEERAFAECFSLKVVTYEGTTEEWNKINSENSGFELCPRLKTVYCSDGEIFIEHLDTLHF